MPYKPTNVAAKRLPVYRFDGMKSNEPEQVDWEDIRNYVVGQIRRMGRRIDVDKVRKFVEEKSGEYGPKGRQYEARFEEFVEKLTKNGYLTPSTGYRRRGPRPPVPPDRRWYSEVAEGADPGASNDIGEYGAEQNSLFRYFHRYRQRIGRSLRRMKTGLRVHLSVFAGVNLFLFMIWGITGGGFPWFIIPAAGWLIGIANHLNALVQRNRQARETAALPDLTEKETHLLRAMHSARTSFGSHFATVASTSLFLTIIHGITTPGGFPWHLIPMAGMGLALTIHYSSYGPKIRRMRRKVMNWIQGRRDGGPVPENRSASGELQDREPGIVQEAAAIRRSIISQADSAKRDGIDMGGDLEVLLDTYVEQIRSLAQKKVDMDRIVAELPIVDLQKDRAALVSRRTRTENPKVQEEYDKSIAEVDQQIASLKEIEQNREVLDLRLRSAMNLMKQLQIDIARAKGAAVTNTTSFEMLKHKSSELSDYIKDLEAGYAELSES